jgi:dissimilatory sulfite reductase (desulfoviridin) alpha/beta subunit
MMQDNGVHMKGGVITERDTSLCTLRTRLPAGVITVSQLRGIADIAEKYQKDVVHLTTRQTIEIPHVDPTQLSSITTDLEKNGTPLGSERDEIVNIIACPGIERCIFANIDTYSLAKQIDTRLFGKEMPTKIRIAISGCPNACTSPMLNEIGIIGRIRGIRAPGQCTGCGTCVQYCKECAISIRRGVSVLDDMKCVQCGTCIRSCPFGLIQAENPHYLITVGGRRGRHPAIGRELITVSTPEQVVEVVDKVVRWVYRRAWSGRLLSDQLDDLRFEAFREEISSSIAETSGSPDRSG